MASTPSLVAAYKSLVLNWKVDVVLTSGLVKLMSAQSLGTAERQSSQLMLPRSWGRTSLALCCPHGAGCFAGLPHFPKTVFLQWLSPRPACSHAGPTPVSSPSTLFSKFSCGEKLLCLRMEMPSRSPAFTFPLSLPLCGAAWYGSKLQGI